MGAIRKLHLPDTYETIVAELRDDWAKMSQFVVPVEDAEEKLVVIAQSIKSAGKVVLLYGIPGSGKSTFIRSLTWRKHLPISEISEIDAAAIFATSNSPLDALFSELHQVANDELESSSPQSIPTLVINYLEDLKGQREDDIRGFFRNVNGLLRRLPCLIIWPVTNRNDAESLLKYASSVSGTVFSEEPIIDFRGPPLREFPRIAKDTISVFNPGLSFDDFLLNDDELALQLESLKGHPLRKQTIRDYLRNVKAAWSEKSGHLQKMLEHVPRPTEIWFIVGYPEAEGVVSMFARKSPYAPDDAWDADYRALSEYIIGHTQRRADWDATRLQYALRGVFRTKIMYLPTNALVSAIASHGNKNGIRGEYLRRIEDVIPFENWKKPVIAKRFFNSSPLVRQLKGEPVKLGKRRSGSSRQSILDARLAFQEINKYCSSISDRPFNHCIAQTLRDCVGVEESSIRAESEHPYLAGIQPDILVRTDRSRIICVEMFYTVNETPSNLADYILGKLDRYMRQLDLYQQEPPGPRQPRLFESL